MHFSTTAGRWLTLIPLAAQTAMRWQLTTSDKSQAIHSYPDQSASHAFVYSGGTMTDLGVSFAPQSINNSGQITGQSELPVVDSIAVAHAFLYSGGTMTDLGTLDTPGNSSGMAINGLGQITGWTSTPSGTHAFVYDGGTMTDLNSLIDPSSGWLLSEGLGINDQGQITGYGYINGGPQHAFLLTPVPEPSSLVFISLACCALSGRRPIRHRICR